MALYILVITDLKIQHRVSDVSMKCLKLYTVYRAWKWLYTVFLLHNVNSSLTEITQMYIKQLTIQLAKTLHFSLHSPASSTLGVIL